MASSSLGPVAATTTSQPATPSTSSLPTSAAISRTELGGIIGGIAGAFFILGGILLVLFLRRRKQEESSAVTLSQDTTSKGESGVLDTAGWHSDTRLRYPEEQNQVGGRLGRFPKERSEIGGRVRE